LQGRAGTIVSLAIIAVVLGLLIYIPRFFDPRTCVIAVVVIFIGGLVVAALGLALLDRLFQDHQGLILTWMWISLAAIFIGLFTLGSGLWRR